MSTARDIRYQATKTISAFHHSDAPVRGLLGPISSGKSVGCSVEIFLRAQKQTPNPQGIRKSRWAVIRNSYPELKSTTIQTWQDWFPMEVCPIVYDAPIRGKMVVPLPDGTTVDLEIYFISLDKPKDIRKLLSLELTGVWINEAREMAKTIVDAALSRTGRYPSKADSPDGITWAGLIMDTNPPGTDHWWYRIFEEVKPDGWELFRQPGALIGIRDERGRIIEYQANPEAENVDNNQLGYAYWMRLTDGADPEWTKVHCEGQYGASFDGKPVYQGIYSDFVHFSPRPLGIFKGLPLYLGWDFGLTPSCIVGQQTPFGQLRVLREYVCERGGVKQFATDVVKPELNRLFQGMAIISTGDPAGGQASQADELTCFRALADCGIPTGPARTNDFLPRRQAVIDRLTRTADGKPAFLIDPSCRIIREGFLGGYKFKRIQVPGEERFKEVPDKNQYSHPHDALQYLTLGVDTVHTVQTHHATPPPPPAPTWSGVL